MENVNIKILTKEYQVSCPIDQQTELHNAVNYLEEKMAAIKQLGKISSFEGILVNVAINLAHEVIQKNAATVQESQNLIDNISIITNKLNAILDQKVYLSKAKKLLTPENT